MWRELTSEVLRLEASLQQAAQRLARTLQRKILGAKCIFEKLMTTRSRRKEVQ
jgi:hypothetical protein